MADTAALVVALSAQLTKFEKDMKNAVGIADREVAKIEDRFKKTNIEFAGLETITSAIGKLIAAGGLGVIIDQMRRLNAEVANIGETSERLGITSDQFQRIRFAVVATGGAVETAASALDVFSRKSSEAARGSGDLYNFLRANNIAVEQFTKLPINEQLSKYADLIKNAKSAQDQFNIAVLAFGRSHAPEMLSALKGGAETLKRLGVEADEAGVILDRALIARARRADEEFKKLQYRMTVFLQELAVGTAGLVEAENKRIEQLGKDTKSNLTGMWDAVVAYIEKVRPDLAPWIKQVEQNLKDAISNAVVTGVPLEGRRGGAEIIAPGRAATFEERFAPAKTPPPPSDESTRMYNEQAAAFQKLLENQAKRIQLLGAEEYAIGRTVGQATEYRTRIELENEAKARGIPLSAARLEKIRQEAVLAGIAAQSLENYRNQWKGLNDAVQFAGDQLINALDGLINKTKTWADVLKDLQQALIKAMLQAVILGQGPLGQILGFGATTPGGTGGLLAGFVNAFKRQHGGPVRAGSPYVVGESGPELFVPRSSGQIVPNQPTSRGGAMGGTAITINNYTARDTETRQSSQQGPSGERIIIDIVKKAQARGELDDVNRGRFGLRPAKVR
jgi:hypothetical protein